MRKVCFVNYFSNVKNDFINMQKNFLTIISMSSYNKLLNIFFSFKRKGMIKKFIR